MGEALAPPGAQPPWQLVRPLLAVGLVCCVVAVRIDELVVRYGNLCAVDHLSFTAEAGRVTAVLGPNGAGKTSTIEVLEGYRAPDGGSVRVLGLDPIAEHRQLVRKMGVMLQQGGVYPTIRVHEVAKLFCDYYDRVRTPRDLLSLVGLTTRSRSTWKQLSGGEQQRLSLALALAGNPSVAFLDEPTASVDVAGRQIVRATIRQLAADGCCVVLTTHELAEAEKVADHVVIVDHGRLVAEGSPDELRSVGSSADEIRFAAPVGLDVKAIAAAIGASVTETTPGEYRVAAAPHPRLIARITSWLADENLPLADLRAGRQSLEDVFLRLTAPDDGEAAK